MNWNPYKKYLNMKKAYTKRLDLICAANYALRELMRKRIEREKIAADVVAGAIAKARKESKLHVEAK